MRAIHLVESHPAAGLQPLCGKWGSMDSDWTAVSSEVSCDACAAEIRLLGNTPARFGTAVADAPARTG